MNPVMHDRSPQPSPAAPDGPALQADALPLDPRAIQEAEREHMLRAQAANFRQFAESIPQLAWIARADGWIFWYNRRWYDYTGTTPEQMEGWGWQSVHDPTELPRVLERWQTSLRIEEPFELEFPLKGADGQFRWFLTRTAPLRDDAGNITLWFGTNTDVDDRRRIAADREAMLRTLRHSEAEFRQLADSMPQIVWAARPDGVLNYYNRRWFEYIKLPESAGDEIAWARYVHPDDLPMVAEQWAESLKSGDRYNLEFRVRNAEGQYRTFLVRALPMRDESGAIVRWFGTCTDIEDRRRIEAEREQLLAGERAARAESENQSRMKDEFLATLSHEIRTPLNAILGWSQIMRASMDPQDIASGLEVIERNARAQSQIIEDLLDMSRIISGKVRLDVQRVDLSAVVQSAVDTARPTAEAKGVRLQSVIDPLHGVAVSGDANRLQQVLWNLISNAIKFTPRNGLVRVVLERVNSHLEISVIDTGEGIKPDFLPYVFDRFRQADASTTRRHGGLGLGLSIVKQLVELHGGSIRVNSAGLGQGTTFIVALPLLVMHVEPAPEPERRHPRAGPGSSGMTDSCRDIAGLRILVIDDEPDARALVKRLLEDCDALVTSTGSVNEAVRLIETGNFDVLVSDIGMPGEDGYSLIRRVRQLDKGKGGDIPAIALTAYARAEDRVKAVAAGFQMHVAKPVEPVELVTMVAGVAGRAGPSSR